ncbi:hypothetical protein BV898_12171 [Hypsibius exemplaris]|uniref:Uncharacterized protein n=1 Tax=Hypsibius exemplaris TaxID=2072580 RepID=A0A1W0WEL1_HYPEX|nr:hypothetical protein BV898_12171 [Hypsibius exemplaris]
MEGALRVFLITIGVICSVVVTCDAAPSEAQAKGILQALAQVEADLKQSAVEIAVSPKVLDNSSPYPARVLRLAQQYVILNQVVKGDDGAANGRSCVAVNTAYGIDVLNAIANVNATIVENATAEEQLYQRQLQQRGAAYAAIFDAGARNVVVAAPGPWSSLLSSFSAATRAIQIIDNTLDTSPQCRSVTIALLKGVISEVGTIVFLRSWRLQQACNDP